MSAREVRATPKSCLKSGRSLCGSCRRSTSLVLLMALFQLMLLWLASQEGVTTQLDDGSLRQGASPKEPIDLRKAENQDQKASISQQTKAKRRFARRAKLPGALPEFSAPIGNVTAVVGRDVRLVCTVEHLGQYQVAWLKEESKTILSIDTNIITTNYRIFLIPDEEERKWVLHIKDVQDSDRGFYQCQVNTIPMRSTSGYLEVVVPPTIIESQTSQVAEAIEHSNVSVQCKAEGHPKPTVSWRRDDGSPIRLNGKFNQLQLAADFAPISSDQSSSADLSQEPNDSSSNHQLPPTQTVMSTLLDDVKSDKLTLYDVDRSMGGIYVCSASNGIPSEAIKKIPVYVKFAPKTSVHSKFISVSLGEPLEIDCLIEANPKADSYWSKKSTSASLKSGALPLQEHFRRSHATSKQNAALRWASTSERRVFTQQPKQLAQFNSDYSSFTSTNDSQSNLDNPSDKSSLFSEQTRFFDPQSHRATSVAADRPQPMPTYLSHPHNRIQFRQADYSKLQLTSSNVPLNFVNKATNRRLIPLISTVDDETSTFNPPKSSFLSDAKSLPLSPSTTNSGDDLSGSRPSYFSVKQTAINFYTYKLKLNVARVQSEHFGEYICTSTNLMGRSESSVIVAKADKTSERDSDQSKEPDESVSSDREGTSRGHQRSHPHQTSAGGGRRSSGGIQVVYDENYLQAIKTRQSSYNSGPGAAAATGRLSQRLKKHFDHSISSRQEPINMMITITIVITLLFIMRLL